MCMCTPIRHNISQDTVNTVWTHTHTVCVYTHTILVMIGRSSHIRSTMHELMRIKLTFITCRTWLHVHTCGSHSNEHLFTHVARHGSNSRVDWFSSIQDTTRPQTDLDNCEGTQGSTYVRMQFTYTSTQKVYRIIIHIYIYGTVQQREWSTHHEASWSITSSRRT